MNKALLVTEYPELKVFRLLDVGLFKPVVQADNLAP